MFFTGFYENSIDTKNRMIIPAKHRVQLGAECVVTSGYDCCLYIYAMEDWMELASKMKSLRQSDPEIRKFIRNTFSKATECKIDSQGRILIPQGLKDNAKIDKDLVTLGAMDKIEIWSKEVYEAMQEDENLMDNQEFIDKLAEYGL